MSKNTHTQWFQTWGDFVRFCVESKCEMPDHDRASAGNVGAWSGASWTEAVALAWGGWKEHAPKLAQVSRAMFNKLGSLVDRQRTVYDVEGIHVDPSRVMFEPECWMKLSPMPTKHAGRKNIKIVYNVTVSGGVSTDVIVARGIAVATLVKLLEYAGNRVELVCCGATTGDSANIETYVRIKSASQDIDAGRLLYACAHPSMLRRMMFSAWEHAPADVRRAHGSIFRFGGYGMVRDGADAGTIKIPGAVFGAHQWTDPDLAEAWVLRNLEAQGVRLFGHASKKSA